MGEELSNSGGENALVDICECIESVRNRDPSEAKLVGEVGKERRYHVSARLRMIRSTSP